MKKLISFLQRQSNQIRVGGWPVFRRKIEKIINQVSIIYGVYFLFLLTRYLAGTLTRRHSIANLRRFGAEFTDLIQENTVYQSNETSVLLMEAERLIAASNPDGAIALYQKAVAIDPRRPEIYFQMANAFYLQGKYGGIFSSYETGLKMLQEESEELGLQLFGLQIINEEGWGFSIGHTSHLDLLVKLGLLGLLSPEKRVVFVRAQSVANLCYLNYWRRHLDIVFLDNQRYRALKSFCSPITEHLSAPKLKRGFVNLYSAWNLAESSWQSENRSPLLELSEADRERGHEILRQWSIPSQGWFVCLHVRESEARIIRSGPDSEILTYIPAIKAITSRGGWVIRMGHPGMKALPSLPNVIDYANAEYKSDRMDVFLWASCRFFIGTSSGPLSVPPTFGRPVLYTNACGIGINANFPNSLMLPKLFWAKEKNRLLTFQEMLDGPMGWTVARVFDGIDGELVDNSPSEIESAVVEMLDKLQHSVGENEVLSDLQKSFNSLRMRYGDTGQMAIAETFAQSHSDLLA